MFLRNFITVEHKYLLPNRVRMHAAHLCDAILCTSINFYTIYIV